MKLDTFWRTCCLYHIVRIMLKVCCKYVKTYNTRQLLVNIYLRKSCVATKELKLNHNIGLEKWLTDE